MSSCFHTAPSSRYSDGLLGPMYTAKCYQAGEKSMLTYEGDEDVSAVSSLEDNRNILFSFTVFDLWFPPVLGYEESEVVQLPQCVRPLR